MKSYPTAREFFRAYYEINQPGLSHRKFAKAIGWPTSLLGDMIQGRKMLTLNRAIEFAKFMDLNNAQAQYMMMLSLKSADNPTVRDYAEKFMKLEDLDGEGNFYSDSDYVILHSYLKSSKGAADVKAIADSLPAFPQFKDETYVKGIISRMQADGVIRGEFPQFEVVKTQVLAPTVAKSQGGAGSYDPADRFVGH